MEKEQYDALMASIEGLGTRLGTVEKKIETGISAASVADKVSTHADALKNCAAGMEAAGVGAHPTRGHVHVLRHMADNLMAEAHQGKIAAEYHAPSMYASGEAPKVDEALKTEIAGLKDGLASITTSLKDLQAAAQKQGAPVRVTLPPRITSLMAKGAVSMPTGSEKLTIAALDTVLKGTSLNPQERMELKIGLGRAGILETDGR